MNPAVNPPSESPTEPRRRPTAWRTGWLIFTLALAVRLVAVWQYRANPTGDLPVVDALTYHQLATGLADGQGFGARFFWQSFFYPLFLAGVYAVTDTSFLAVRLLQALLGAGTCVLGWWLGRRLRSEFTGLATGLALAFYGPLIAQECELLPTTWEAFWLTALLAWLAAPRPDARTGLALGLTAAALVLTRAFFLPFVLLAGAVHAWNTFRADPRTPALKSLATCLAAFVLPLAGVAGLSARVTGHFQAIPGSGGFNFYLGNNPNSAVTEALRPGEAVMDIYRRAEQNKAGDRQATSPFFYAESGRYIRQQPVHFARGLLRKTAMFFSSREIPRNLDVYLYRQWTPVLRPLVWKWGGFGFPFGILGPLALLGLVAGWRRWPVALRLCVLVCPLTVIAYIAAGRYRLPLIPALAVLAAGGLDSLADAARPRAWPRLWLSAALVVATGMAICFPRQFRVERTDFAAELDYGLGGTLLSFGRPAEAAARFEAAWQRQPDYVEARFNHGSALARQGKLSEAIRQWQEVLRLKPDDADARRALERAGQRVSPP